MAYILPHWAYVLNRSDNRRKFGVVAKPNPLVSNEEVGLAGRTIGARIRVSAISLENLQNNKAQTAAQNHITHTETRSSL